MAVEWTITIEGRNEFGNVCRKAVRIDKSRERLFDGDLGLSMEDGKTIMAALQSARAAAFALPALQILSSFISGFRPSSTASWRCAILVGCCVGIVTQAWSLPLRRCGRSARTERHPS
ncbi:hypothetical protein MesoLj131b_74060 (plasmid) [Mesorhizobium sp. 131-2-5]|nr:hypothetical protein MesoLj131b_74060 [Mesorhizobium sp. 131-2-5]